MPPSDDTGPLLPLTIHVPEYMLRGAAPNFVADAILRTTRAIDLQYRRALIETYGVPEHFADPLTIGEYLRWCERNGWPAQRGDDATGLFIIDPSVPDVGAVSAEGLLYRYYAGDRYGWIPLERTWGDRYPDMA